MNADAVRDRVPNGVLAGQVERLGRDVGRDDVTSASAPPAAERHGEGDRDRPAARPDVDDPDGCAPAGRAADGESPHHLGLGELDEALGLGPRDQRPGVDREGQSVELLEAADVGDGLAGSPSFQRGPIGGLGIDADRAPRGGPGSRSGPRRRRGRAAARRRAAASPSRLAMQALDPLVEQRPDRRHGARTRPQSRIVTATSPTLRRTSALVGPAPAVEQEVDRGLADAQVVSGHLARASRAGAGGELELVRSACGAQAQHRRAGTGTGDAAAHACGEQATGYGTGIVGVVAVEAAEQLGQPEVREALGRLEDRTDDAVGGVVEAVALHAGGDERVSCGQTVPVW